MVVAIVYAVISSLILLCSAQDSILYTAGSLSDTVWENRGSLTDKDITDFGAGHVQSITYNDKTINAMCWTTTDYGGISIAYDINSDAAPQLTMEAWIYPYEYGTPNSYEWVLGSDRDYADVWNRGIIIAGTNNIALGAGDGWTSNKVSFVNSYEWVHVVGVFDDTAHTATIYLNGGLLLGGEQATDQNAVQSNGLTNVMLNPGTGENGDHFSGCIGRIQITNEIMTAKEVMKLYLKGATTFGVPGITKTKKVRSGGGSAASGVGGPVVITATPPGGNADMYCCSAVVSNPKIFETCPKFSKKVLCDKKAGKCEWLACSSVGYCAGTTGKAKKAGYCREQMNSADCANNKGCAWNAGLPPYTYLENMGAVLSADVNVDAANGYNNMVMYAIILFIVMGVVIYYKCYKDKVSQGLLNETETIVQSCDKYGSV